MSEPQFIKFPKTPHLQGSAVVDDDQICGLQFLTAAPKMKGFDRICIQEKVDGTNVSVHFEADWVPTVQKRSGLVGTGERPQYNAFRDWVYSNLEMMWEMLGTKYCIFGEWLWAQHSVTYTKLPSYFVAFDIYDKEENIYLSRPRMLEIVGEQAITVVPLVAEWTAANLPREDEMTPQLQKLIEVTSVYGDETREGVYIRIESQTAVLDRVKLRRKTFQSGRSDFDKNVINNGLLEQ